MFRAARLFALAQRLQARAQPQRPPTLEPFVVAGQAVGWVTSAVADALTQDATFDRRDGLLRCGRRPRCRRRSRRLAEAAERLRDAGRCAAGASTARGASRARRSMLATIERAACRTLGIVTEAVHLNALADDGTLIVARRAAHKSIDPGQWDNLVGGMVPAGETSSRRSSARRGKPGWHWTESKCITDACFMSAAGARGLPIGWIHVYDATLGADDLSNQDGEVDAIERRDLPALLDAMENVPSRWNQHWRRWRA
jgi:hypothetical protein